MEYITQPDFKLTGQIQNGFEWLDINKQRRPFKIDEFVNTPSNDRTPSMQLNKPSEYWDALLAGIPDNEAYLFITVFGRNTYLDEIILCLSLNIPDEYQNQVRVFSTFLKWHKFLYERLSTIVGDVSKLTTGATGSRRAAYQHYFYTNQFPRETDAVIRALNKIILTPLTPSTDFENNVALLHRDLLILQHSEDVPVLDLMDLTLEQLNVVVKLLPKDNNWISARKRRIKFFENIIADLDSIVELNKQLYQLQHSIDELSKKYLQNVPMNVPDMQKLLEFQKTPKIYTIQQKLKTRIEPINMFITLYNSANIFKYRNTTLTDTTTTIKDLLDSQFMAFIQTLKTHHTKILTASVESQLFKQPEATFEYMKQFYMTPEAKEQINEIVILLHIYKLVTKQPQIDINPTLEILNQHLDIPAPTDENNLITAINIRQTKLTGDVKLKTPESARIFEILLKIGGDDERIIKALTLICTVLPHYYVQRLHRLTKIVSEQNIYTPIIL